MPFYRFDPGSYANLFDDPADAGVAWDPPEPAREFDYEPATARFDLAEITGAAGLALQFLLDLGVTELRITYNGGHDDDFAQLDSVRFEGSDRSGEDLIEQLA